MVSFTLSPQKMLTEEYAIDALDWKSIKYGEEEIEEVPNDKRCVYAFAICEPNDVLPTHCYIYVYGYRREGLRAAATSAIQGLSKPAKDT